MIFETPVKSMGLKNEFTVLINIATLVLTLSLIKYSLITLYIYLSNYRIYYIILIKLSLVVN